jgi:hypothetical protein
MSRLIEGAIIYGRNKAGSGYIAGVEQFAV